jgi:hypothetical protein
MLKVMPALMCPAFMTANRGADSGRVVGRFAVCLNAVHQYKPSAFAGAVFYVEQLKGNTNFDLPGVGWAKFRAGEPAPL